MLLKIFQSDSVHCNLMCLFWGFLWWKTPGHPIDYDQSGGRTFPDFKQVPYGEGSSLMKSQLIIGKSHESSIFIVSPFCREGIDEAVLSHRRTSTQQCCAMGIKHLKSLTTWLFVKQLHQRNKNKIHITGPLCDGSWGSGLYFFQCQATCWSNAIRASVSIVMTSLWIVFWIFFLLWNYRIGWPKSSLSGESKCLTPEMNLPFYKANGSKASIMGSSKLIWITKEDF